MVGDMRSALIAGVIAFVAHTVTALLTGTGTGFGPAAGVGLVYLVGTAIVVFTMILAISAVRRNKRAA